MILTVDKWTDTPVMLMSVRRWVLGIAAGLVLSAAVTREWPMAFGLAIGTALALWHLSRIVLSVAKSLTMSKEEAQVYGAVAYVTRYLTTAAVLAFVYFSGNISFGALVVGLLLPKIVITVAAVRQQLKEGGIAYLKRWAAGRTQEKGGQ